MTHPVNPLFAKISRNNLIIDKFVDDLVETACDRNSQNPKLDKQELEKTSTLVFLASLIQGEKED